MEEERDETTVYNEDETYYEGEDSEYESEKGDEVKSLAPVEEENSQRDQLSISSRISCTVLSFSFSSSLLFSDVFSVSFDCFVFDSICVCALAEFHYGH